MAVTCAPTNAGYMSFLLKVMHQVTLAGPFMSLDKIREQDACVRPKHPQGLISEHFSKQSDMLGNSVVEECQEIRAW